MKLYDAYMKEIKGKYDEYFMFTKRTAALSEESYGKLIEFIQDNIGLVWRIEADPARVSKIISREIGRMGGQEKTSIIIEYSMQADVYANRPSERKTIYYTLQRREQIARNKYKLHKREVRLELMSFWKTGVKINNFNEEHEDIMKFLFNSMMVIGNFVERNIEVNTIINEIPIKRKKTVTETDTESVVKLLEAVNKDKAKMKELITQQIRHDLESRNPIQEIESEINNFQRTIFHTYKSKMNTLLDYLESNYDPEDIAREIISNKETVSIGTHSMFDFAVEINKRIQEYERGARIRSVRQEYAPMVMRLEMTAQNSEELMDHLKTNSIKIPGTFYVHGLIVNKIYNLGVYMRTKPSLIFKLKELMPTLNSTETDELQKLLNQLRAMDIIFWEDIIDSGNEDYVTIFQRVARIGDPTLILSRTYPDANFAQGTGRDITRVKGQNLAVIYDISATMEMESRQLLARKNLSMDIALQKIKTEKIQLVYAELCQGNSKTVTKEEFMPEIISRIERWNLDSAYRQINSDKELFMTRIDEAKRRIVERIKNNSIIRKYIAQDIESSIDIFYKEIVPENTGEKDLIVGVEYSMPENVRIITEEEWEQQDSF